MYKNFILGYCLIMMSCSSCRKVSDKDHFIGDIVEVEISNYDMINKFDSIFIEDDMFGQIAVYDTLMFCWNQKVSVGDFYYYIYSLNSGQKIGEFFSKGNGPNETSGVPPIFDIYNEQGCLKSLIFAPNNFKLYMWNISASLHNDALICDEIYDYNWMIDHQAAYLDIAFLNNDTLIARIPSRPLSLSSAETSLPTLEIRSLSSNKLIKSIDLYKKTIYNDNEDCIISPYKFFGVNACINSQKNKLAHAMSWIGQLNIIDVRTGQINSTRIKNSTDLSIFSGKMEDAKYYYHSITADDNYIYGLYADEYILDPKPYEAYDKIHVFDWNGVLIKAIKLPIQTRQLCADKKNGILYAYDDLGRIIYKFDLYDVVN